MYVIDNYCSVVSYEVLCCSLSVEIDADTTVGDSGSETDSFGASDFGDCEYVVFHCCVVNNVD